MREMATFFDEISFATKSDFEIVNLTNKIKESVNKSRIKDGIVVIFTKHTTCSLRVSEDEKSLLEDYKRFFSGLAPKDHNYGHNKTNVDERPNAHAHLQSMTLNSSETIPLRNGELLLGTWQSILFVELDGPRPERRVTVEVIG